MRKLQLIICSALFVGGLAACTNQSVDPTSTYYDQNDKDIQTYATQKNLNGKTDPSGLYYVITTLNPNGKAATVGEEIEFTYKSYNLKDVLIDSSAAGKPVYYPLGIQSILVGLEKGLSLMREGEKATLLIPSYIGYGATAVNASLPAYSVVRFDIALKRSRSEAQQIQQYLTDKKLVATDSSSTGLKIVKTLNNPSGTVPSIGQTLTIKYKGKQLRAATAFDSTGTGTFDAVLGQGKYVKGFEEGLAKLKVGEKATILFPSSIGYGTTGVVSGNQYLIPPYAPLLFELEVVSAK